MLDVVVIAHMSGTSVVVSFLSAVDAERHRVHDGVILVRHAIQGNVSAFRRDEGSLRSFRRRDGTVIAPRRKKRR